MKIEKIFGLLFLSIAFIPLESIFGKLKGADGSLTSYEWFLISTISLSLSTIFAIYLPNSIIRTCGILGTKIISALDSARGRALLMLAIGSSLFLTSCFAFWNRPHLVDSMVQVFQAKIFASGHLTALVPKYPQFFITLHMLMDENGWYSQYPPGHSALLAIGELLGKAWIVPRLLSISSAFFIYTITRKLYDRKTANLVLFLSLFCPFFIFMGASLMNHVSTLFFISLFVLSYIKWEESKRAHFLSLAGFAIACAGMIRPLTALAIALPFAFFALSFCKKHKIYAQLIPGFICASLTSSLFLIYNTLTSGKPFLTGYIKLWGKSHGLGFQESPWGEMHTAIGGLRNELIDLRLLNEYLFEWPIPSLAPLALFLIFSKKLETWDKRFLLCFLMIPGTYFFYWHRDAFLGPRFLYEGLVFILPLSARAISSGIKELGDRKIYKLNLRTGAYTLLVLCFLYSALVAVPQRFLIYASSFKNEKINLIDEAKKQGIDKGLVFVSVSWGNRIIAKLRAQGLSASLAQKAYSFSDHCLLYLLSKKSELENWDSSKLSIEIEELIARKDVLEKTSALNKDPTLKLRPNTKLDPQCIEEITYDRSGEYALCTPSIVSNDPDLNGEIVLARDMRVENYKLIEQYKDMPAYLYKNERFNRLKMR